MRTTYDPNVYNLCELFLSDDPDLNTEAHRHELATIIQGELESWIEHFRNRTSLTDNPDAQPN